MGTATPRPLDPDGVRRLIEVLDETPETVGPIHLLTQGACKAYAVGDPASSDAVVVQSDSLRAEPVGIGDDAAGLWSLLRHLDDWTCVDVSPTVAPRLGALIREATGKPVCYYGDVHHTLTRPAPVFDEPAVRELTRDDIGLPQADGVDGASFRGALALGDHGAVAGAVVDGQIVGTAHTAAVTGAYAEIGVAVDEAWRRRGFATASASIVARRMQETGRTPVWSCGEDNMASLRVARKLEFEEVSRLTYVIRGA